MCNKAPHKTAMLGSTDGWGGGKQVIYIPGDWSYGACNLVELSIAIGGRCHWGECLFGQSDKLVKPVAAVTDLFWAVSRGTIDE